MPTFSSPAPARSNRFEELQKKLRAKDAEAKKAIENMHKQCKKFVKHVTKEVVQGIDTTILSSFVQPVERDGTMPMHAILPVPGQMIPPTLSKLQSTPVQVQHEVA